MNEYGAFGVIKWSSQVAASVGEVFTFQVNKLWFLKEILDTARATRTLLAVNLVSFHTSLV